MENRISHNEERRFCDAEKYEQGIGDGGGPTDCQRREYSQLDENSPVSHIYLTFDADLPSPPTSSDNAASVQTVLPPCPELKAFTSPLTWAVSRKRVLLFLSCLSTFITAYSAGAYSPPSPLIAADFATTHLISLIGITTFCAGFGLAPMVLAPISEIWGRYPILVVAGVVFVVFEIVCAVVTNIAGMLVARFFVGCGGSVFSSIIGGVLADLWNKEDRNTAMSLFSGSVLVGTGAGPLVASAFVSGLSNPTRAWQWSFYHQAITGGVTVLAIVIFFRETRASVLLSRKARKLNSWYEELEKAGVYGLWVYESGNGLTPTSTTAYPSQKGGALVLRRVRWKVHADEERASLRTMMATSIKRPFYLLFTEPIVFSFSLWAAFAWGVLYLAFAVVPYLHGGDFNSSARTYIAMIAGAVVATAVSVWQEELLQHPQWRQDAEARHSASRFWAFMRRWFPAESPEARLYFACITAMFLPAGLFGAFMSPATTVNKEEGDGGTALAIGFGFATWGIYAVYLASFNYLADSYHIYASSVLAANSFARNVIGGVLPICTAPMFDAMKIRPAGLLLGILATALTTIPWVLVFWGPAIRARSQMAIVSNLKHFIEKTYH
jgi:MFS family permease